MYTGWRVQNSQYTQDGGWRIVNIHRMENSQCTQDGGWRIVNVHITQQFISIRNKTDPNQMFVARYKFYYKYILNSYKYFVCAYNHLSVCYFYT